MMNFKKIMAACALAVVTAGSASADYTISARQDMGGKPMVVEAVAIENIVNARSRQDLNPVYDTVALAVAPVTVKSIDRPARVSFIMDGRTAEQIFVKPGEAVNVIVEPDGTVKASGTPLIDQINGLSALIEPVLAQYRTASEAGDEAGMDAARALYVKTLEDFVAADPAAEGAAFAVMQMNGEGMVTNFAKLSGAAVESVLYPLVAHYVKRAEKSVAAERLQLSMEESHAEAPDFTLPDLDGKQVSLSSFRGKWVILDFWGSWCGWCIKGFPGLKKAYEQYKGKLEIVGVDCNDPEANWRAAVKKFQLPWVNLYNGGEQAAALLEKYGVQGFPTKILINPEGKIARIFVGEDPAFYEALDAALK